MQKTVVKKVRLSEKEAKDLARLAKRRKTTESEVLREGLRREAVSESRNKMIDQLIQWAEEEGWEWQRPDVEVKW